jgi:hypothetical protein
MIIQLFYARYSLLLLLSFFLWVTNDTTLHMIAPRDGSSWPSQIVGLHRYFPLDHAQYCLLYQDIFTFCEEGRSCSVLRRFV